MACDSLVGQPLHQLNELVPATYVLCGLSEVEFGDLQRFALKWSGILSSPDADPSAGLRCRDASLTDQD